MYNRALAEWCRAWFQEQRRIGWAETDKMLTGWKRDPDTCWLTGPSKGPLQATLRHLQTAYVNFWEKRAGYPSFKNKGRAVDSATYFRKCFAFRGGQLTLAKQAEPLAIVWSRPLPDGADPSQVTVSRNARGQYHVSIVVECPVGPACGRRAGRAGRGDHLAGYAVHRGEDRQPAPRASGSGASGTRSAGTVPEEERISEPGQGANEGGPDTRSDP
ncbi:hypothetical protein FRACA_210025 [Frankia canadensis]|uniref:Transposase n=1 Tax=Frankia canadensis TaxID=1836972 RepID=A0A2I2KQL4_9ACTN|nr:hypothetical protein FRACA_210025 [Frankia canadensis]SOU55230.1 hypothetical protein FRACA_210025 [Frankia canadensis]